MLLGHGKESWKMPHLFENSDSIQVMEVSHVQTTPWHMIMMRWMRQVLVFGDVATGWFVIQEREGEAPL